ncbi:MAG: hypothetical protein PHZ25_00680 [Candidatus Pacebacteria bacterium]|nr:hypothetical protein [Candidatus Paceibacterota bacterium]
MTNSNDKIIFKKEAKEIGELIYSKKRDGQVMFLTVVVLGVIIASVTVVAGLLMSYQIKRSADVSHSARAVFAADAGVECMLFGMFYEGKNGTEAKAFCDEEGLDFEFKNKASFSIEISEEESLSGIGSGIPRYFNSTGKYGSAVRTIRINL